MSHARRAAPALSLLAALAAAAAGACTSTAQCTPEEYGLENATRLTTRELPAPETTESECPNPRVEIVGSDAELRALYDRLGMFTSSSESAPGEEPAEYPSVDFSRERVIVREGHADEGISWAVADGDTATVGLLGCMRTGPMGMCSVTLLAVPALVTQVESRTCDPVRCGAPSNRR